MRVLLLGAAALLAAAKPAAESAKGPVVLELFTSQGCSSCPPADALLTELAKNPDVLALSFHVDYWDYLGWKDPASAAAWTTRQRAYASAFGEGRVYTPQLVVNGKTGFVGSSRTQAENALAAARKVPRLAVRASAVAAKDGGWSVTVESEGARRALRADVLLVEESVVTAVRSGENEGRTLRNDRVVRQLAGAGEIPAAHAGPWRGAARLEPGKGSSIVVLVQDVETLEIAGAAVIPVPR